MDEPVNSNPSGLEEPRVAPAVFSITQPITTGLEEDVTAIIERTVALFDESETLEFQHFVSVWQEMHFGLVSSDFLDMFQNFETLIFLRYFVAGSNIVNSSNLSKISFKSSRID